MPAPNDSNIHILLNSILEQARATAAKLDTVVNEMVTKAEFARVEDRLERRMDDSQEQFTDIRSRLETHDHQYRDLRVQVDRNDVVIRRFSDTVIWALRLLAVAALGIGTTILTGHLKPPNIQAPSFSNAVPHVQSSPHQTGNAVY